jgi:methyl-accepting chemotaxis protein
MAEQQDAKIKQLIEGLQKTIRTVGNSSKEQVQINRELLKVIALLESGLARNEEDAKALIAQVRKGLSLTDEEAQTWAKERKIAKKDLDSILIKFRKIETLHGKINDQAEDFNDSLSDTEDSLDLQIDLSARLFDSYKEINSAIDQSRKAVEKFGVGAADANKAMSQVINTTLSKRGILTSVFDDMFSSLDSASGLIQKLQDDAQTMVNNLSGISVDVPVNFDPKSGQLDAEVSQVKEMIELENTARLAGLVDFFNKNEELQKNLSRKIASSLPGH